MTNPKGFCERCYNNYCNVCENDRNNCIECDDGYYIKNRYESYSGDKTLTTASRVGYPGNQNHNCLPCSTADCRDCNASTGCSTSANSVSFCDSNQDVCKKCYNG